MNPTTIRVNHFRAPVSDVIVHQPLTPSLGYSLEMPAAWTVILDNARRCLRAILAAKVTHRYEGSLVQRGDADFSIRLVDRPAYLDLRTYAEAEMKKHIPPEAEPERFMDRIGGYRACRYGWTDGIQEHATWFVEHVATTTVRIDYSMVTFGPLAREGVTPREEGANLLARLEWRVPQA